MEAAKQEIKQTGRVRCLGRQSKSRDRGEHDRGNGVSMVYCDAAPRQSPSAKSLQTTIRLDNRADGRFVPRISRKYRKSSPPCGKPTVWPALICGYGKETVNHSRGAE
jgi:hypothetical protein